MPEAPQHEKLSLIEASPSSAPRRVRRYRWWSVAASGAVHIAAIGAVEVLGVWALFSLVQISPPAQPKAVEIEVAWADAEPPTPLATLAAPNVEEGIDLTAGSTAPPALAAPELAEFYEGEDDVPAPVEDIGEFARREVFHAVEIAEREEADQQRAQLEGLGGRLERLSDEERVAAMSDRLSAWLGTNDRAAAPNEEAEGSFDFDTAQPHEVTRAVAESGAVTYQAVMVDAQGRQFTVALTEAEGKELYKTMRLIRRYPLMEKVYRGVVMSLLDNVIEGLEQAEATPSP